MDLQSQQNYLRYINYKNKNETNTNITFTINRDKFQQLLFLTADIMFINLLENKLCFEF